MVVDILRGSTYIGPDSLVELNNMWPFIFLENVRACAGAGVGAAVLHSSVIATSTSMAQFNVSA